MTYISPLPVTRVLDLSAGGAGVAVGSVPGLSSFSQFGHNPDVDIATAPEDVFSLGATYAGHPSQAGAAETVDLTSDSANDTNTAGTGARTVRVYGLNDSWNLVEEDVDLDGVTAATTAGLFHRVFGAKVLTAGSLATNDGVITINHTTTAANVFGAISAGEGQMFVGAYTVPVGYSAVISSATVSSTGAATYSIRGRENGGIYIASFIGDTSADPKVFDSPLVFPERTDIKVTVESTVADDNSVRAHLNIVLIAV